MTQPSEHTQHPEEKTVSLYATRKKIYARATSGLFAKWRIMLVVFTQLIFYGLAWLPWNGRQSVLFDLTTRRFYIFDWIFWPQDFIFLTALLIISALSLFLFTAVAGRLFCGYACPQTVYTEIFMWIENWVEGDRNKRMKLDNASMDFNKLRIKITKHGLWLALGIFTGFTFVGYFTPIRELAHSFSSFNMSGWETFWVFFYGGFTYLQAGFMREQVCKYMCPYARFQSVMFDPDTLIISYDPERGEPRGARNKKNADQKLGDCVNCGICVQVCPTGIDIRDGLQYECIGCAACIDACDQVMDKVGAPRGLVRYTTENALRHKYKETDLKQHVLRPRVLIYTAVWTVLLAATIVSLMMRIPLRVDVIRDRGTLVREADDGMLENVYRLQIMNTDEKPHQYKITASGLPGLKVVSEQPAFAVESATTATFTISLRVNPDDVKVGSHQVMLHIQSPDNVKLRVDEKTSFLVK